MNTPTTEAVISQFKNPELDRVGFLFALGGTVFFSAKAIFIKLAFLQGVHPDVLLALRMGFALPFFLLIAIHSTWHRISRPKAKHLATVMLLGVLGYYVANTLDMYGLQYLPATLERLIIFTYPAIVLLLATCFTDFRPQPLLIASIIVTYGGLILVFSDGANNAQTTKDNFTLGVLLVGLSAVAFAGFKFGAGEIMRRLSARIFTAYAMLGASIAIALHYALRQEVSLLAEQTPVIYAYAIILAVLCTILPSFMISEAVKRVGAPLASAIGGIGPVMTILLAMIILEETLSPIQLAGSAVIIVSIMSLGRLR